GAGKPIPDLDKPHDELWWIKRKLRDEELASLPPTIALRKHAEEAMAPPHRPARGGRAGPGARRPGRQRGRGPGHRGRDQRQDRRGQPQGRLRSPAEPGPLRPRAGGRPPARRPRARGLAARLTLEHRLEGVVEVAVAAVGLAVGLLALG